MLMGMDLEGRVLLVRALWGFVVGLTFALIGEPSNIIESPLPPWALNSLFLLLLYFPSAFLVKYVGGSGIKILITKGFLMYIAIALLTWIALY